MAEGARRTLRLPIPEEEYFAPGHNACAGCGCALAMRLLLKTAGPNVIIAQATGCMEVVSTPYPLTSWRVPWIHLAFENAAAAASGIEAALKALGREDTHVIAIAGDGGTADIGFQALSGMLERGHDVLFVCYDNEAYMNTGIQRSSSTPFGAWTTTSPVGRRIRGKREWKKDVPAIVAAHNIPYVATASVAYPKDFMRKVRKGLDVDGPAYIQVHAACVPGWRIDPSKSIEVCRLAVETGMWLLYEVENGEFKLSPVTKAALKKRKPVREYLRMQGRFRHLTDEEIEMIQRHIDERCKRLESE